MECNGGSAPVSSGGTTGGGHGQGEREEAEWQLDTGPGYLGICNSPFHLMREGLFFSKKKEGFWGLLEGKKLTHLSQYSSFMGDEGEIGEVLEMLGPSIAHLLPNNSRIS